MALQTNERIEFAEFYKDLQFLPAPSERVVCSSGVTYIGQREIQTDIQLFKSALAEANVRTEDAFMCVLAPGWLEHFFHNEHYATDEDTHDLPLKHVIDLMLRVKAGAYSVEAANPRHEHEWKIWKEAKLPEGKILIPGVVSHASNVVEHPELVADRILLYAGLVGRENVIAGTDCGMGMRVHPQIAWAKLKALSEGAALATSELWGRPAPE
jgi:hypothetical protein